MVLGGAAAGLLAQGVLAWSGSPPGPSGGLAGSYALPVIQRRKIFAWKQSFKVEEVAPLGGRAAALVWVLTASAPLRWTARPGCFGRTPSIVRSGYRNVAASVN